MPSPQGNEKWTRATAEKATAVKEASQSQVSNYQCWNYDGEEERNSGYDATKEHRYRMHPGNKVEGFESKRNWRWIQDVLSWRENI